MLYDIHTGITDAVAVFFGYLNYRGEERVL